MLECNLQEPEIWLTLVLNRDQAVHGIFALKLGGTTHNFVTNPYLGASIFSNSRALDSEGLQWRVMKNVFGFRQSQWEAFRPALPDMNEVVSRSLLENPGLEETTETWKRFIESTIPDMISFSSSPIDMSPWERAANAQLDASGINPSVEIDMFKLLQYTMASISTPAIFGLDFVDNYPALLNDLFEMDVSFAMFAKGVPWWTPYVPYRKSYDARRRLLRYMTKWHQAMDRAKSGEEQIGHWDDFSDLSVMMQGRYEVWRKYNCTPKVRAPADLAILWATNVNASPLCFWIIYHIFAEPGLVERVRDEIKSHISVKLDDESTLPIHEAPQIKVSIEGLVESCPLLKSCYLESTRLDSSPRTSKKVLKEFTISDESQSNNIAFSLTKDSYVEVPHGLHQSDPMYFNDPSTFNPERFIDPSSASKGRKSIVNQGTLRPYGGGAGMCKGRIIAERECLAFVAAILTLWDFEPADGEWKDPGHIKASAVCYPRIDPRVRITRRKL
jgi:cytochrome P450